MIEVGTGTGGRRGSEERTPMDERLSAITHGLGAFFAAIGLIVLLVAARGQGTAWHLVSACIFGVSVFLLYLASTLYHSLTGKKAKRIFRIIDHAAIYFLIAGTYTPFSLVLLNGTLGWTVFSVIWCLAFTGVGIKVLFVSRFKMLSTVCYVIMGWLVLVFIKPLAAVLPTAGLCWLVAGGLFYTIGAVFYLSDRFPYSHTVWHLFVLSGTVSHFIAILCYVIPIPVPS